MNRDAPIFMITFNPALDLGGVVDDIIPNEKNYVYRESRNPGGNAINAARIAHRLGVSVLALGFIGGSVGHEVHDLLASEGVPNKFTKISSQTRINVTVSDRKTHLQTRLSFPGPHIKSSEWKEFTEILFKKVKDENLVVLGGSLPPGLTSNQISELVLNLKKRRIESVVDMPGPILEKVASAGPFMIKPNLTEFQQFTKKPCQSIDEVIRVARSYSRSIPLICVSSVEGGSVLVTEFAAWFGKIKSLQVKTTVGAGDSMVGGMVVELWKNKLTFRKSPCFTRNIVDHGAEILKVGLAAACSTIESEGGQLGSKEQLEQALSRITVKRIVYQEVNQEHRIGT